MIVLALDLATNLGFAWGPHDGRPVLGHERLPSTREDVGLFLCAYEDWLRPVLESTGADIIVFEAPILAKVTNVTTVRKLTGLAAVTEMIACREGLACFETSIQSVKKALTGNGRATKSEMVAAARAHGFDPHVTRADGEDASDEADALGVWIHTIRTRFPALAGKWAPPANTTNLFAGASA